jgi:site-specific DNA-cytosine methylase
MTVFSKVRLDWPYPRHEVVTVGDALRDVKPDRFSAYQYDARLLKHVQPGELLERAWSRIFPNEKRQPSFGHRRLRSDWPSYTAVGRDSFVHPTEHRRLAVSEFAALCGFPKSYRWAANLRQCYYEIGKGVTPPVARYMANVFARGLDRAAAVDEGEEWLVNYQTRSTRVAATDRLRIIERIGS